MINKDCMRHIMIIAGIMAATISLPAQKILRLDEVNAVIEKSHPALKMLDAEARSMDEAAKGAYSWMPPEFGAGLFLTPYNPARWKSVDGQPGMGMFALTAQQMFPSKKKQDAEYAYMNSESSVEKQKKEVVINELLFTA